MGIPFSWSLSRHQTFDSCRRRYYYSYYAAAGDPEIKRLKDLSALPLWAGSVVHEAIEGFLRETDHAPEPEEREAFIRSVVHTRMVGDWRESEGAHGRFRLFEHEYAVPVLPEDKKAAVSTVTRSLRAFFESKALREALTVGRGEWLSLEELVSFDVDDVKVLLRMDLAYRLPDGHVVIVDWKTGRSEGRFNDVQLGTYALYAHDAGWVASPDALETELAYLVIPRLLRRGVDGRRLDSVREFVSKSATSMRSLLQDPKENLAQVDAFPMVERPQLCRRCNFRRLCFPRAEAAAFDAPQR